MAPLKVTLSGLRPLFGLAVAGLLMFSLLTLPSYSAHAQAGGISLIRDTEAERVLRATLAMLLSMAAGLAAMIAGAGEAGQAILMAGQQIAQRTFMAYSRTVEASADQAGMRFLTATHQSGMGMLQVFKRFQDQEILSSQRPDPFAQSHPAPA